MPSTPEAGLDKEKTKGREKIYIFPECISHLAPAIEVSPGRAGGKVAAAGGTAEPAPLLVALLALL